MYLATWKNKGVEQKVAVKIPSMHSSNVEAVKKDLKREIKTMSSLHHPNVVKLLGISECMCVCVHLYVYVCEFEHVRVHMCRHVL